MRLLCFADQKAGIPDLADPAGLGRRYVEEMLTTNGSEVLILDNLSALCSGSGEADNDVASWLIMQAWLLKLRAAGISVILIHHTE
jgi:hypothetical protein